MKLSPLRSLVLLSALVASGVAALIAWTSSLEAVKFAPTSRSTTVLLTGDDARLLVVNRESNSLAILRVRGPKGTSITDAAETIAEVTVGLEPRCVALHPKEQQAYVTNGISGTVSVVELTGPNAFTVTGEIQGLTEPRGCALSPSGKFLYVANHTADTVSIIDTTTRTIVNTVTVGGNPMAIAVTNDGDADDNDETVFVTQFFAELIPPPGPGEGRDLGKRGVVRSFTGPFTAPNPTITTINLSPLANSGFTANRTNFCPNFNAAIHPPHVLNPIFCPDPAAPGPPAAAPATITANPQGVFPNQLASAVLRGDRLWLPNIGAQPEPPVQFTVNVQALVHVVNAAATPPAEVTGEHVNLNAQLRNEPAPANPTASLAGLFGNDLVAIDANQDGSVFLIVSRGANYVLRATRDAAGALTVGAPSNIVRFQTGNLPSGVVISKDGKRAYANNEANVSVTAINLETNTVINRDIPAGEPAAPGTFAHAVLVGKLAFFTALGIPDNGIFDTPIRAFDPLLSRGKMSSNAWSSCGSCHPDGLSDGVTWFFPNGPRQTISLDGTFAKDSPNHDQRILNWSAARGSNTDFNNNSRAVQGGCGFASDLFSAAGACLAPGGGAATAANPDIFDHGITQGASDALDAQTLWIFQAVRPLKQPQPTDGVALAAGRAVFTTSCASCHGGAKWTKSQIFHRDNPSFPSNPAVAGVLPFDAGLLNMGVQLRQFTCGGQTIQYLNDIGTFNLANPLEIQGAGATQGQTALGTLGFNSPTLFSIRFSAPYLHNGQAQTLAAVFPLHGLGAPPNTIATLLTAQQQADLLVFLNSIDGTTDQIRSDGDVFRDATKTAPCPP
jgi:YVTN family beta-propeller protein